MEVRWKAAEMVESRRREAVVRGTMEVGDGGAWDHGGGMCGEWRQWVEIPDLKEKGRNVRLRSKRERNL